MDANRAYSRKQALAQAEKFAESDVRWFEEPVSSDDLEGLRLLRDRGPAGAVVFQTSADSIGRAARPAFFKLPRFAKPSACHFLFIVRQPFIRRWLAHCRHFGWGNISLTTRGLKKCFSKVLPSRWMAH